MKQWGVPINQLRQFIRAFLRIRVPLVDLLDTPSLRGHASPIWKSAVKEASKLASHGICLSFPRFEEQKVSYSSMSKVCFTPVSTPSDELLPEAFICVRELQFPFISRGPYFLCTLAVWIGVVHMAYPTTHFSWPISVFTSKPNWSVSNETRVSSSGLCNLVDLL